MLDNGPKFCSVQATAPLNGLVVKVTDLESLHILNVKALYVTVFDSKIYTSRVQLTLAISNSLISNNRLSRSENLVPA